MSGRSSTWPPKREIAGERVGLNPTANALSRSASESEAYSRSRYERAYWFSRPSGFTRTPSRFSYTIRCGGIGGGGLSSAHAGRLRARPTTATERAPIPRLAMGPEGTANVPYLTWKEACQFFRRTRDAPLRKRAGPMRSGQRSEPNAGQALARARSAPTSIPSAALGRRPWRTLPCGLCSITTR